MEGLSSNKRRSDRSGFVRCNEPPGVGPSSRSVVSIWSCSKFGVNRLRRQPGDSCSGWLKLAVDLVTINHPVKLPFEKTSIRGEFGPSLFASIQQAPQH
jgi:hypothetical protein